MVPHTGSTDIGVEEHFRLNATAHPNADAVVEGDRTVSYGELDRLVARVASHITKHDPHIEEPIGILLPKGIASVVANVAIVRVGASCVPLDLAFPDQRVHKLFANLKVRIVVTNSAERHRAPSCSNIILIDESDLVDDVAYDMTLPQSNIVRTGATHRTHVLHTSGTTGEPKGVEVLSKGIMHLANNTVAFQLKHTDRVAQVAAPSFDPILYEIWATLVVGGCVVIMSKEALMDPCLFHKTVRQHRVTGMLMTPTLMQHLVSAIPNIFAGMDWVVTGGEPANPKVYQTIFENDPPKVLANAYGPTEATCVTSYHSACPEDCLMATIPIGKPLDGVTLTILDENQAPVKDGAVGELYIGGGTIARGYHNRPEVTATRFCKITSTSGQLHTYFRTGDLARYTSTGNIDFIGRNDDMIKIHSKRIDLAEVKAVIMDSGLAVDTVILPVSRTHKDTYIVAFTIPLKTNTLSIRQLETHMKQFLPDYMIPRIEFVHSLPMTPHGKADRRLLLNDHITACEKAEQEHCTLKSTSNNTHAWLKSLWISLLGFCKIDNESNFFDCGGTSLQAAALLMHIRRRFNLTINMYHIYNAPTLQQLVNFIDQAKCTIGTTTNSTDTSILDILIADSRLVSNISVPRYKVSDWRALNRGHIFMTGATGYLGMHCLRDMIRRSDVKEVRCLVRNVDACTGRLQLLSLLKELGVNNHKQLRKVIAVPGVLGEANFGLSVSAFSDLAAWADTIFHIGAHVNWSQPYESHRASNVIGTLDCIQLAVTSHVKSLHYVSTAALGGTIGAFTGQERVMEDTDLSDFQNMLPYDLGYTQSKWVAEKMVSTMQKKGLPAVVYRPGFIMGDGVRGKVNHKDFMARFIRGCVQLGYHPVSPGHSQLMITADFCSAAIIHIASDPGNHGYTFHVVPQTRQDDIDLDTMWTMLSKIGHKSLPISFKDWIEIISKDKHAIQNPLFSALPTLQQPIHNGRSLWELHQNMATYDTTNCRAALANMKCQARSGIDREFLINYMNELNAQDPIIGSRKAVHGKY